MIIFTFSTTSRVYQAEAAISNAGLKARLRPLPPGVTSRCGLCLQLREGDRAQALRELGQSLAPVAVYMPGATSSDPWQESTA